MIQSRAFARFAWLFLAWLLLVIVYGAWVRITGSGAGCGSHWPLCDGELLPRAPSAEKFVEFTHRATSGLAGLLGIAVVVGAFRTHPRGHAVRRAAVATFALLIVEALLGAGLVVFGLVTDNDSGVRAAVVALHLANTLLLTGAAGLTAYLASGGSLGWPERGALRWLLVAALCGLVVTSMSGAVTALGDTLFPVRGSEVPAAHFLVRLRIVHPMIAVVVSLALLHLSVYVRGRGPGARVWASALAALIVVELALGVLNVILAAPGWMQLVHLFFAQAVWLAALFMSAAALHAEASVPSAAEARVGEIAAPRA